MYKKTLIIIIGIVLIISVIVFCTLDKETTKIEELKTDINYVNVVYNEEKDLFTDDVIATLIIEKIDLTASIKEGSTSDVLENYIGHIEDTPFYDGNVGLAAHNRGNQYSYFARLNELEEGDIVTYKTIYGTREYKVSNIEIILETDWSNLKDTQDNKLTMITCIANRANQRLCVQATEIK